MTAGRPAAPGINVVAVTRGKPEAPASIITAQPVRS